MPDHHVPLGSSQYRKAPAFTTYITHRSTELAMMLPANLAKGSYRLEVRGTVNGVERTGQLPDTLRVG